MQTNIFSSPSLFLTFLFIRRSFYRVNAATVGIYRSPCRSDVLFKKATAVGKYLAGSGNNLIETQTSTTLLACSRGCLRVPACLSINFFKSKNGNKCDLVRIGKTSAGAKYVSRTGWVHYEPVTQIGPRCRLVTCNAGYECTENCQSLIGYKCIEINECDSNPCQNGATCANLVNQYSCTCVPGYSGTNCQTNINECASSPCQNSGTCTDLVNKYSCTCAAGYTGTNCETNINECASNPCKNSGTCTDKVNRYSCTCAPGYRGRNCGIEINECASNPCKNGATCNNLVNRYSCTCVPGYYGTNCQAERNECASSPCQHQGTCADLVNRYSCTCRAGYVGTNCQTDVNECASNPCQNSATCRDRMNRYYCSCAAGYTGTNCQTDVNECASNPCQNGATCNDLVNRYSCTCVPGYYGTNCQSNLNECASSPCQNSGTCQDGVNGYTCTCTTLYQGVHCETDKPLDCSSYTVLSELNRHMNQKTGSIYCDSGLNGDYRFMGQAGTRMPTSCVTQEYCSTHASGWMQGSLPYTYQGTVTRTVCFSYVSQCCWQSQTIQVRNCGSYYVYRLTPTKCSFRYCGTH